VAEEVPPGGPQKIDATFRNGSITVVGVLVGFSLTFLTSWALSPQPWKVVDLLGLVPMLAGVALQLWALAALLDVDSLEIRRYRPAIRHSLTGLILVGAGVTIAIVLDALRAAHVDLG